MHDIAGKRQPFTDFKQHIQLEKINKVKFQPGSYENKSSCRDFIKAISEFFSSKRYTQETFIVNFIAILCDGTKDTSITEQDVVYIFFIDLDTTEPTLTFFECLGLESSQDTNGILDAIKVAFEKFHLSSLLDSGISIS